MASYIALIHQDPGSDYGVSFPDFPGCVTAGASIDEAKDMASEALSGHVEMMREEGLDIPEPTSLEDILADPENRDAAAFLVVSLPPARSRTVRLNITMPEDALRRIDAYAKRQGLSRSSFLVRAAQRLLAEQEAKHVGQ
jgi:predicted RNase H-like HicB family nuclease